MAQDTSLRWPVDVSGRCVLLECDDPALEDGLRRVLIEGGYTVAHCAGPGSRASSMCPLVTEGHCGLVEEAHVIVHALDPADPAHRDVLSAVVDSCPGTPVVVEARALRAQEIDVVSGDVRPVDALDRSSVLDALNGTA